MAHIEAYSYGSSNAAHISTNRIEVDEQGGAPVAVIVQDPFVFSDALSAYGSELTNASAFNYSVSYDATIQRVTITQVGGLGFKPVFTGVGGAQIAAFLGFNAAASYAYDSAHQGTLPPAGRLECVGIECQPPQDASRVEIQRFRLGRAMAPIFGNHSLFDLQLVFKTANVTADWSWLTTGRVRAYISASATPYSPSNLGGYIDGYVRASNNLELLGQDQGLAVVPLIVAVSR